MKFTLSWLRPISRPTPRSTTITDTLTGIGLELEGVTDPGAALRAVPRRARGRGRAAPERRPAARLHGGCGGRPGLRRVRRAERADRHEGGVRAAGQLHPGHRHHPQGGRDPRRDQRRHAAVACARWGSARSHDGIVELPADAPVGDALPRLCRARRPGDRDRGHAEPRRRARRARRRARPRRGRAGHAAPVVARRRCRAAFASPIRWAIDMPEPAPGCWAAPSAACATGRARTGCSARLTSIGLRPINALVDVTNFFTFDLGRPLHVFDADRVAGRRAAFRPGAGETLPRAERPRLHGATRRTASSPTRPACSRWPA